MAVVEEWLSSTEPGLQIDSPPLSALSSRSDIAKKFLLLIKHFKFGGQDGSPALLNSFLRSSVFRCFFLIIPKLPLRKAFSR